MSAALCSAALAAEPIDKDTARDQILDVLFRPQSAASVQVKVPRCFLHIVCCVLINGGILMGGGILPQAVELVLREAAPLDDA